MIGDVVDALACPVCAEALALDGRTLACSQGHTFDLARQGYVNLLHGRSSASTADTPDMVAARAEFIAAGHLEPVTDALVDAMREHMTDGVSGVFLDVGAGTGEQLARLLDASPDRFGVALDVSKPAARLAARAHERIGAVVANVWDALPLRDGSAALVTCVFSPRNAEEFSRVLAPAGMLVVVTPEQSHLTELVGPLGLVRVDPRKAERLADTLSEWFDAVGEQKLTYTRALDRTSALQAVLMGPSAAHLSADEAERRLDKLPLPIEVTFAVRVGVYRPLSHGATLA